MEGLGHYIDAKNTEIIADWEKDRINDQGPNMQVHSLASAVSTIKISLFEFLAQVSHCFQSQATRVLW